jgi:hypothetical protein
MKNYLFLIISLGIGIFAFSNIILPIFYVIPRLKREKREGNLLKKVPIFKVLYPILFWITVLILVIQYAKYNLEKSFTIICIGFSLSAIAIIITLIKKNPDMDDDFKRNFKEYLKNK